MFKKLTAWSINCPVYTVIVTLVLSIILGLQLFGIKIDTDPENMLATDQPDRVLYNQIKEDFAIHDLIVLGLTDDAGIFRPSTLRQVSVIIDGILMISGVVTDDVISLRTTNNVRASGGLVEVRKILHEIPETEAGLDALRTSIIDNPLFDDKIISVDGTGLAIYIPIVSKDQAHRIGEEISALVEPTLQAGQQFYLAGLPIAEDRFGVEMFVQMAIMAPISGMVIFALLWLMFRKVMLVVPAMGVAMLTVMWGMGLLVGFGNTVHIMSSMIPVFLMPIAVLDAVHILSDFYDRYPRLQDRRQALEETMDELHKPMMYTSLTSSVGFASLLLADIPPVQIFGSFVAVGILVAWLMSITFIPACIMLLDEKRLLASIGRPVSETSLLSRLLTTLGGFAYRNPLVIGGAAAGLLVLGGAGIMRSVVNDNPVNWFEYDHEVRIADRAMNELFGGTYMAYVLIEGDAEGAIKRPEVMLYIDGLQRHVLEDPAVGKTSSVTDIVRQINYVLHEGDGGFREVPQTLDEVAQYLFLYQMSGDVGDLDNFVDYDYRQAIIWVQFKAGQNQDMARVKTMVDDYIAEQPLPDGLALHWSGLNYINKVWQDLMVSGMIQAVMGSFVAVFVLMCMLLRSITLALLSMLPLTIAMTMCYGLAGFVGKEYDMPIAVCSSLALGLSIDFAIHFVQRYRRYVTKFGGDLAATNKMMFEEPARAIARNAVIITVGFLPMVLSPLSPYQIVGLFFALLMIFSSLTTLLLLPGLMRSTYGRFWGSDKSMQESLA